MAFIQTLNVIITWISKNLSIGYDITRYVILSREKEKENIRNIVFSKLYDADLLLCWRRTTKI